MLKRRNKSSCVDHTLKHTLVSKEKKPKNLWTNQPTEHL